VRHWEFISGAKGLECARSKMMTKAAEYLLSCVRALQDGMKKTFAKTGPANKEKTEKFFTYLRSCIETLEEECGKEIPRWAYEERQDAAVDLSNACMQLASFEDLHPDLSEAKKGAAATLAKMCTAMVAWYMDRAFISHEKKREMCLDLSALKVAFPCIVETRREFSLLC